MSPEIGPYSTATAMLAALDDKTISSVELVELHVRRIEELDGLLNAIPVHNLPSPSLDQNDRSQKSRVTPNG